MPSEPIALPILDTADVLTAAYEQLVRYRAYIEAAREITRGSSTPRPAFNVRSSTSPSPAVPHAHSNATSLENSASTLAAATAVAAPNTVVDSVADAKTTATAIAEAHSKLPNTASPNSTSTSFLYPASTHTPFSERDLLLPIPYTLRLTPLTLTLHAFLPVFYAERPLLGIDTHSLVILARDLPSRHHPPYPCAFASIHLPVPIDPTRCTAAFHHGSLGIRLLRAPSLATSSASASPTPTV